MPDDLLQLTRSMPTTRRSEEPRVVARKVIPTNTGIAKVASEIARIEPRAEMDFEIVKAIADQETTSRS